VQQRRRLRQCREQWRPRRQPYAQTMRCVSHPRTLLSACFSLLEAAVSLQLVYFRWLPRSARMSFPAERLQLNFPKDSPVSLNAGRQNPYSAVNYLVVESSLVNPVLRAASAAFELRKAL
jgi:hypothetical protein